MGGWILCMRDATFINLVFAFPLCLGVGEAVSTFDLSRRLCFASEGAGPYMLLIPLINFSEWGSEHRN